MVFSGGGGGGGTSNGVAKCRLFSQAGGGGSVERGELGTKRKSSRRAVRGMQLFYSFCGI